MKHVTFFSLAALLFASALPAAPAQAEPLEGKAGGKAKAEVNRYLQLLDRAYQPGEREVIQRLGDLYEQRGDDSVKAFVNGKPLEFDVPPFVQNGRVLVPIRAISAALKADVKYEAATRTVVITRGDTAITLYLDKAEALVNGAVVKLDAKPVIKKGRLFLPLRFVSEQLKAHVEWQAKGKIVMIEDPTLIEPADPADAESTGEENGGASRGTGPTQAPAETNAQTETGTSAPSGGPN